MVGTNSLKRPETISLCEVDDSLLLNDSIVSC